MIVHDGRIGITREELDAMKDRGFCVSEHTLYYMNGITVTIGDTTIGLYNWLDGLDVYLGGTKILINTVEEAQSVLDAMDAFVKLQSCKTD